MGLVFNPFLGTFDFTGTSGSGSGDVTHTGTLTAHEVILGNGGADIKALGSLGSAGQVLTSNGLGNDPSWQAAGTGTIGGTIAATQVAFGTALDTIGGSGNLTWDGSTLTSLGGLFRESGALAPTGATPTALLVTAPNGNNWHLGILNTTYSTSRDDAFNFYQNNDGSSFISFGGAFAELLPTGVVSLSATKIDTASLTLGNSALRTNTTDGQFFTIQAYDVDAAAYKTFATLTNSNTPSFVITPPSGGTVTVNATTLQQGGNSISLAGSFTTSGAFAVTQTYTGATNVTFPTSGTLLTTSGSGTSLTFPGTLSIASGKTLTASSTFNLTGTDGKGIDVGAATSGKFLIGDGTNLVLSTSTIPSSAGATAGKVLVSDGTNYVLSTPTFPNASATSGKFIRSDGTNWVASTPTLPTSAGTAGKVLASDGTNYVESTPTFPYTSAGATGGIIQSDGTNWVRRSRVIACSGTASSSLTGTTNETNLAIVTITGGIMGANSCLVITTLWKFTGTAGTKNRVVRVSTVSGDTSTGTLYCNFAGTNTNLSSLQQTIIWNANSTSSQIGNENGQLAGSVNTNPTSSINTGADFYINLNGKLSNTGDTEQLVGYTVELITP